MRASKHSPLHVVGPIARLPRGSRGARGLTLIELCAGVLALVGLCAGVMPALRSARSASQTTACQQNLGRIQQAALVYAASDPNELMIPIGAGDAASQSIYTSAYGYGGKSGWWLSKLNGQPATQSPLAGGPQYKMGARDRPLNRILFKTPFGGPPLVTGRGGPVEDWSFDMRWDVGVYHCPSDAGFPGLHHAGWKNSHLSSYDYYGTSYSASTLFIKTGAPSEPLKSLSVYAREASAVPAPSSTIAYMENAARFAWIVNNPALDQSGGCWPYIFADYIAHGWHGQDFQFNVAFADGSVGSRETRGFGRQPDLVCPPGLLCDCFAVRTADWRIDTAPAPLKVTSKSYPSTGTWMVLNDGYSVGGNSWDIVQ